MNDFETWASSKEASFLDRQKLAYAAYKFGKTQGKSDRDANLIIYGFLFGIVFFRTVSWFLK